MKSMEEISMIQLIFGANRGTLKLTLWGLANLSSSISHVHSVEVPLGKHVFQTFPYNQG
jgi:hypothetical protein